MEKILGQLGAKNDQSIVCEVFKQKCVGEKMAGVTADECQVLVLASKVLSLWWLKLQNFQRTLSQKLSSKRTQDSSRIEFFLTDSVSFLTLH